MGLDGGGQWWRPFSAVLGHSMDESGRLVWPYERSCLAFFPVFLETWVWKDPF